MKNQYQKRKKLKSDKKCADPIYLCYYKQEQYIGKLISYILVKIEKEQPNTTVFLLGRTKYDKNLFIYSSHEYFVLPENTEVSFDVKCKKTKSLKITFHTIHKAKGLEADNVIILNCKNDRLGFPNKMEDDPIMQILLSEEDSFPYAEERRLMYVAVTRTKNRTYLLVPDLNPSEFIEELKPDCKIVKSKKEQFISFNPTCPKCKTGRLVLRKNEETKKEFVGCSHNLKCGFTANDVTILTAPRICECGGYIDKKLSRENRYYYQCTDCKRYYRYHNN